MNFAKFLRTTSPLVAASEESMHFVKKWKIKTLIKTKRNRKWKIPHTVLERRPCASAHMRIVILLFCPKEIVFNICVLYQCIVYRIHVQNMHNFTCQKAKPHTLFCLFLKSSKVFSVSLTCSICISYLFVSLTFRFKFQFYSSSNKTQRLKI